MSTVLGCTMNTQADAIYISGVLSFLEAWWVVRYAAESIQTVLYA